MPAQNQGGTRRAAAARAVVDRVRRLPGLARELKARRLAELGRHRQHEDLDEAQKLASIGSWSVDSTTGELYWSDGMWRLAGLTPRATEPQWSLFEGEAVDQSVEASLVQQLADHGEFSFERELVRPDGTRMVLAGHGREVLRADGTTARVVGSFQDITRQRDLEAELVRRSRTDLLTGSGNRYRLVEELAARLDGGNLPDEQLTLLDLDVVHFRNVNESYGPDVGDALLRAVTERLAGQLRGGDVLARIGGDEFAILVGGMDAPSAMRFAQRLREALQQPFDLDGLGVQVDVRVGIAGRALDAPPGTAQAAAHTLVQEAALALDAARHTPSRMLGYSSELRDRARRSAAVQGALRGAVERGEVSVVYQPLVDLGSGRLRGAEALARWTHPTLGTISPLEFIPLAESSGLIVPLGRWVLQTACTAAAAWRSAKGTAAPSLSVNVSRLQLADELFADQVSEVLARTGLPPDRLCLEITESVLSDDPDIEGRLGRLQALGLRLSIDDFGTGVSSLSALARLPVDELKIDKGFIDDITTSERSRKLVQSVVALGRSLGLTTLAEGVETTEQHQVLQAMGCEAGQGWLFGRPGPASVLDTSGGRRLRVLPSDEVVAERRAHG